MGIQVLLVLFVVGVVWFIARQKASAISAFKKIGLVLLAIVMAVSVAFPQLTTVIANTLGIGRGADLLLYGLTATFIVYALTQYTRAQANRRVLFSLARKIALLEAETRYAHRLPEGPAQE